MLKESRFGWLEWKDGCLWGLVNEYFEPLDDLLEPFDGKFVEVTVREIKERTQESALMQELGKLKLALVGSMASVCSMPASAFEIKAQGGGGEGSKLGISLLIIGKEKK